MLFQKEDNELTCLLNTSEESFGIEERKANTIREEIRKQNEKNSKIEFKCSQLEEKLKLQEKYKVTNTFLFLSTKFLNGPLL